MDGPYLLANSLMADRTPSSDQPFLQREGSFTIWVFQNRNLSSIIAWVLSSDMSITRTSLSGTPRELDGDQPIRYGPSPSKVAFWVCASLIADSAAFRS